MDIVSLDNSTEDIKIGHRKDIIMAFVKEDLKTSLNSKLSLSEKIFQIILCSLSWLAGHQFLLRFSINENNGFNLLNYNFWWFFLIPIVFSAILFLLILIIMILKKRFCERESYIILIIYNSLYFIWFIYLFKFLNNNDNNNADNDKYQIIIYYIPIILTSNYSMIPGENLIFMNSQYEIFIELTDFVNIYLLISNSKIFDFNYVIYYIWFIYFFLLFCQKFFYHVGGIKYFSFLWNLNIFLIFLNSISNIVSFNLRTYILVNRQFKDIKTFLFSLKNIVQIFNIFKLFDDYLNLKRLPFVDFDFIVNKIGGSKFRKFKFVIWFLTSFIIQSSLVTLTILICIDSIVIMVFLAIFGSIEIIFIFLLFSNLKENNACFFTYSAIVYISNFIFTVINIYPLYWNLNFRIKINIFDFEFDNEHIFVMIYFLLFFNVFFKSFSFYSVFNYYNFLNIDEKSENELNAYKLSLRIRIISVFTFISSCMNLWTGGLNLKFSYTYSIFSEILSSSEYLFFYGFSIFILIYNYRFIDFDSHSTFNILKVLLVTNLFNSILGLILRLQYVYPIDEFLIYNFYFSIQFLFFYLIMIFSNKEIANHWRYDKIALLFPNEIPKLCLDSLV